MTMFGTPPSPEELDAMMRRADENGSGTIDFEEFIKLRAKTWRRVHRTTSSKQLSQCLIVMVTVQSQPKIAGIL